MTENTAIKWINTLKNWNSILPEAQEACEIAEKWFEEIQQYRAIGTVEEIRSMIRKSDFTPKPSKEELIAELKELSKIKMMLECFEAIGTIEEFKALKEKSVAKKPVNKHKRFSVMGFCTSCQMDVYYPSQTNYCSHCGQKLDWND